MACEEVNILTLAMAKKYTDKSLAGAGAVAGVPCQIQSINQITGGNRITFLWVDNNNVSHTSTLDVMDGAGGEENKIDSISVNGSPISIDENKNVDITVPSIEGLTKDTDLATVAKSGSYDDLSNKPEIPSIEGLAKTADIPTKVSELENDSNYLSSIPEEYITDTELEAKGYLTEHQDISGKVDKVEGKSLISDTEIARLASVDNYDDTALSNRVKTVEDEVPNLATKTYVGEQIANAEHLKREIVTVLPSDEEASDNTIYMLKVESATGNDKYQEYMKIDGTVQMVGDTSVDLTDYAKTADIPTKVSELENDSNYLSSIPEEYITDTELEAKGYLTEHQDISGKVDKVEGKSLISDTEIARLASVDNYDDTALSNRVKTVEDEVPNLATKTYVGEQIANAEHLKREIVTVLPSDEEASDNTIYMLKVESATGNDKYQEYMKIDGTVQMVGDTSVDLTDYAKTADIPTKVSELENDSNYLSSIPEEYITDTELEAKGYLTEHQDISGKVDKVEGKSLISDTEIARLASVDNYDDTALSNRVKTVEDEVPNLATKTYVGEQIANAEHLKREIVTVLPSDEEASDNTIYMLKVESATGNDKYQEYMKIDGTVQMVGDTSVDLTDYAKTADIPTKVSELENDSNYLSSIPEEYITDTELEAKGYLTEHQDISGKVDKVEGKSLISDTEIARLASVDNYDDTALSNRVKTVEDEVPNLATKTYVGEQIANAEHLKREIVTVLPSDEEASDNTIYMLKVESATGNDKYQEYMKIDGTVQMVGDTSVDLTDYAKTADIPTTVAELTDSADYAKKTDLHSHTNKTVLDGITSTKVSNWDSAKTHADSAHAPSNAQANVIETVKVNGTALTPSSKAVNVTVPTKVSELTDGSDYAKKTELNNYSYLGSNATRISENDDLNNYITPGIYTCSSISIAKTLLNLPTGVDSSFRLEVIINTGDGTNLYGSQEMKTNSNKNFIRTIRGTYGWTDWKELATMDDINQLDIDQTNLKILGWIVPDKMSVRNYKQNNVFYQKVDRVNLSNFTWTYDTTNKFWYSTNTELNNMKLGMNIPFVSDYPMTSLWHNEENIIRLYSTSTSSPSGYLYYELAEEKAISIYGNEIIAKMSNNLGGLTFSASGKTLSITDGKNTWTLEANS